MEPPTSEAPLARGESGIRPETVDQDESALLEPSDRLDLERVLLWLRLTFLLAALLPFAAFGPSALPYSVLIAVSVLFSYGLIALLRRCCPEILLRNQLGLRVLDCGLVFLILYNYHGFLGNAYYDAVYVFFVVSAAATHGRRGTVVVAVVAGLAVALSRLALIAGGLIPPEPRHLTDSVFYVIFFLITGIAVASLLFHISEVVKRRERAWSAELADRNARLERTATRLAEANKELEAFSYSVSHDLRAPLRSIDGFSQALLEDYGERLGAEGQMLLRRVRAASQRMAELIDDLLSLSRVTRGELRREPVDLSALARSVVEDLQASDPSRVVEVSIEPGLLANGDSRLLRVALENLLGNAWKFTSRREDACIEFGATTSDGERVYYVRDNGIGFDMAYAGKLFGTFQRLHSRTEFEGTGIGLATVQRIIHRHDGRIWAEAAVGEGATFYFTL